MYFIEYGGDNSITMDNLKAIKENGNASGYENTLKVLQTVIKYMNILQNRKILKH